MKQYTPYDHTGPATIDAGCDQSEYPNMPGHGSPMNPGHDGNPNLRHTVQAKHKSYQREREPITPVT